MTATATRPCPVPEEGAAGSVLEPRKSRIKELLLSRGAMFAYVFILPYVLFFTVFRIGPALYGMVLSFGRYSLAGRLRRSAEHTSELPSRGQLVCRLPLEKKTNDARE